MMRTRKNLPQVFVIFKLNYCMACGLILEKCYVHNIFTPLSQQILISRLLQVLNLNSSLKLLSCPLVTVNNNLLHKIYCESVVKISLWKCCTDSIPLNIMFSYNCNKWCHNVVTLLLKTIVILLPVRVWKGNNVLFFNIMFFNGRVNAFKCLKSSQIVYWVGTQNWHVNHLFVLTCLKNKSLGIQTQSMTGMAANSW